MKTSDFDYDLPPGFIAAFPTPRRDHSRLMCLGRYGGTTVHSEFSRIGEHLPPGALIVVNDTRVIPARLRGRKSSGGGVELLLIRRAENVDAGTGEQWEAIGRNLAGTAVGTRLVLDGGVAVEIRGHGDLGAISVALWPPAGETVRAFLERTGEIPLPPYIETERKVHLESRAEGANVAVNTSELDRASELNRARELDRARALDRDRYQTVYATNPGAVAAPTAGLHFTDDLLARLKEAGHQILPLTLHVGLGTFRPVKVDEVDQHQMESEEYAISPQTAEAVNDAKRTGRPVLAVGTTVVRALESSALAGDGIVRAGTASSRLFLRPGATFQIVTDLVTNFHLPRSTLLMLVSAFAGRERVLAAYAEAIASSYRFYSYGDAMLIRGTP